MCPKNEQTTSTTSSLAAPESDHCSWGDGDDGDDGDRGYDGDDGDRRAELEADLSGKGNKTHVKHCLQCGQPVQQESELVFVIKNTLKFFKIFFTSPFCF